MGIWVIICNRNCLRRVIRLLYFDMCIRGYKFNSEIKVDRNMIFIFILMMFVLFFWLLFFEFLFLVCLFLLFILVLVFMFLFFLFF